MPCELLDPLALAHEAAAKYAFIVAINALGLAAAHTVGEWRALDPSRVDAVVAEASALAAQRIGARDAFDEIVMRVRDGASGFAALPTRGRSSAARVDRALGHATRLSVSVPTLATLRADAMTPSTD